MDLDFIFKEPKWKMLKSLLSNWKVPHRCSEDQKEPEIFQYDKLKHHIVSECPGFKYTCKLCVQRDNMIYAKQ
jgi:hypothetical protein